MSLAPIAYLTCELKGRDLDSRLLLAARLLERGVACVVGQQWAIWDAVDTLPQGCLVMTSASAVQAHNAGVFKAAGHRIVMSDEEALALTSHEHWLYNITSSAFAAADVFCAQSAAHKAVLGGGDKVVVTGNPRCDLLTTIGRRAFEAEARELCGGAPFILFNSNFALEHFVWGDVNELTREKAEAHGIRLDMLEWECTNKRLFIELIEWCVDNCRNHQIVIRPHPAERAGSWADVAALSARIKVVEGSMPIAWLMAAACVVHTNCTTGLEAAMLGTPCINLSPDVNAEWHNAFITKDVNATAWSVSAASEMILMALDDSLPRDTAIDPAPGLIDRHLPRWADGRAAESVVNVIVRELTAADYCVSHDFALGIRLARKPPTRERRNKFYVTREEVEARLSNIANAFGICDDVTIHTRELDESAVLMVRS